MTTREGRAHIIHEAVGKQGHDGTRGTSLRDRRTFAGKGRVRSAAARRTGRLCSAAECVRHAAHPAGRETAECAAVQPERQGGNLFMRFTMPRLCAPSGIAHSGKRQNHECGVSMHGSSQRFLSMPKRHFGRRPRFRKPPCERKLRSERHGTTTVAGPTRKLFFIMEKGFFSVKAGSGKAWPLRQVAEKTTFFPKRENGKDFFVTIMCFSSHG